MAFIFQHDADRNFLPVIHFLGLQSRHHVNEIRNVRWADTDNIIPKLALNDAQYPIPIKCNNIVPHGDILDFWLIVSHRDFISASPSKN